MSALPEKLSRQSSLYYPLLLFVFPHGKIAAEMEPAFLLSDFSLHSIFYSPVPGEGR